MRRASFRDRALVLRTYDFGEADRVVVLLTENHGIVRSVAKGVRRAKSRFGSRVQLFVLLDVHLYPGRNLATITAADTVEYFGSGIIDDYQRYSAACAVLEAAERLALAEGGEDPWLFTSTATTLRTLQTAQHPLLHMDAFFLQAMAHAGWAPSVFNCAQCGRPGPHHVFHAPSGGALCVYCRPSGAREVPEQALRVMWYLERGDVAGATQVISATDAPDHLAGVVDSLTRQHVTTFIERKLASLQVLDQG
ncbi:DNA repair protein RecO [Corynebacterium renale]|uniref:DNA repair protein RecO n=1 Tax=Corynebacterium renale TaxID=1724 RepID=A0A2A9DQV6_9CORY|nr:DNA repair protein RecO [Corynebacterium renale]PFG28299.1 DNA replication and repair protein RecO [Corynebacterium renale]SQI19262.1 DNA repair protein RecO [Corynebacterium renale]